jgi:hypothetical protein
VNGSGANSNKMAMRMDFYSFYCIPKTAEKGGRIPKEFFGKAFLYLPPSLSYPWKNVWKNFPIPAPFKS